MNSIFYAALVVHVIFGTLALVAGVGPLVTRKGGRRHRLTGSWYQRIMYGVIGSAAVMSILALKPYFAALTLGAAISTFSGIRVLRRKRPDVDAAQRAQALDWGFLVLGTGLLLALLVSALAGEMGQNATVFYALIGGSAAYLLWDWWRFLFPAAWPAFPNLWFYEHLVKMLASMSAVVAAFSGSVLHFLPIAEPWKQLWSTILFHNLMLGMIVWYAFLKRRVASWRARHAAA